MTGTIFSRAQDLLQAELLDVNQRIDHHEAVLLSLHRTRDGLRESLTAIRNQADVVTYTPLKIVYERDTEEG